MENKFWMIILQYWWPSNAKDKFVALYNPDSVHKENVFRVQCFPSSFLVYAMVFCLAIFTLFDSDLYGQNITLPWSEGFESGVLDPALWTANPGSPNGVAEVKSITDIPTINHTQNGSYGLALGKSVSNINEGVLNTVDLTLDLSGYEGKELRFSFWISDFYDNNHAEDALLIGNGNTFSVVKQFKPSSWDSEVYGSFFPFDLDRLIEEHNLNYNNVVFRFSQFGYYDFVNTNGDTEDGIFIDDLLIEEEPTVIPINTFPYCEDFENSLKLPAAWRVSNPVEDGATANDPEWLGRFWRSGLATISEVSGVNHTPNGSNGLALGKWSDNDDQFLNVNCVDLYLDLSEYSDQDLTFSFWVKDKFDEDHAEDGIWMSSNGGLSFKKINQMQFTPQAWVSDEYGAYVPFDLDEIINSDPDLAFSENFVIRFQQLDNKDFEEGNSDSEDGLMFDDICVNVETIEYADLPYFEDFENLNPLDNYWALRSRKAVEQTALPNTLTRFWIADKYSTADYDEINHTPAGFFGIALGKSSDSNLEADNTNALDLHINLASYENCDSVELTFWVNDIQDENSFFDGIFLSSDGGNSFTSSAAVNFFPQNINSYTQINLDLDDTINNDPDLAFSETFVIRFQQYDNKDFENGNSDSEDGIFIDDISITAGCAPNLDCSNGPILAINNTEPACSPLSGSISVSASSGNSPYSYSLNNGAPQSSGNFNNLDPGSYEVIVNDSDGCADTISNILIQGGVTISEVSVQQLSCPPEDNGEISIDAEGAPLEFSIDGGVNYQSSNTFSGLTEGDYNVSVLNTSTGCETTWSDNPVTIIPCSPATEICNNNIDDDGDNLIDCEDPDCAPDIEVSNTGPYMAGDSIMLMVTGGTSYSWSGPDGFSSAQQNPIIANGDTTNAGIYYVSVSNDAGCAVTDSTEVIFSAVMDTCDMEDILFESITIIPDQCDASNTGGMIINISGGQAPYTFILQPVDSVSTEPEFMGLAPGNYEILVIDNNGCMDSTNVTVDSLVCDLEDIGIDSLVLEVEEDSLIIIIGTTDTSTITIWDWDDGQVDTFDFANLNATHVYDSPGTYEPCVSIINDQGQWDSCFVINILAGSTPLDSVIILEVPGTIGCQGDTLDIPVIIKNCDTIQTLQGTSDLIGDGFEVIELTPDVITPNFILLDNEATFSYFDFGGFGQEVMDGDTLFHISVLLNGMPGDNALAVLNDSLITLEVGCTSLPGFDNPYLSVGGTIEIVECYNIDGFVHTYWDDPIKGANIFFDLSNGQLNSSLTAADGTYQSPDIPEELDVLLYGERDSSITNGLSTAALFVGQNYILLANPPEITSPFQIIAGDVNNTNTFSTADLFAIQRVILGIDDVFPAAPSWVFIPDIYTPVNWFNNDDNLFPYPQDTIIESISQDQTINFTGVKMGDLLGNADGQMLQGEADDRSWGQLPLIAQSVEKEGELQLYFHSREFMNIGSYQFALRFDTTQLEFKGFAPNTESTLTKPLVNERLANEGQVLVSWFSLSGSSHSLPAEEPIFGLSFHKKAFTNDLSEVIRLDEPLLPSEVYTGEGKWMKVTLAFEGQVLSSHGIDANASVKLHQNIPNPFGKSTFIPFDLPQDSPAELIIQNQVGQTVASYRNTFHKGRNQFEINDLELAPGLYFYTLRVGAFRETKRMVVY